MVGSHQEQVVEALGTRLAEGCCRELGIVDKQAAIPDSLLQGSISKCGGVIGAISASGRRQHKPVGETQQPGRRLPVASYGLS